MFSDSVSIPLAWMFCEFSFCYSPKLVLPHKTLRDKVQKEKEKKMRDLFQLVPNSVNPKTKRDSMLIELDYLGK